MNDVLDRIASLVLVPVIEIPEAALAVPLADALMAGGLPCAEITFRTAAAAEAIEAISRSRPDLLVGAGTVVSPAQVDIAREAGAQFIVSPGFDAAIVDRCRDRSIAVLPGVVTPTEVQRAMEHGLGVAKFFPAEPAGGAAYLRALTAPFPRFRFVPTGGISASNLRSYLAIPQVVAVGGSWMTPRDLLLGRDFAVIEQRVHEATTLAAELRPGAVALAPPPNPDRG